MEYQSADGIQWLTFAKWAITAGTPDVLEFLVQFWDGEIAKSHINR